MMYLAKELDLKYWENFILLLENKHQFDSNMIKYFTEKVSPKDFYISEFKRNILNFPCFILYI